RYSPVPKTEPRNHRQPLGAYSIRAKSCRTRASLSIKLFVRGGSVSRSSSPCDSTYPSVESATPQEGGCAQSRRRRAANPRRTGDPNGRRHAAVLDAGAPVGGGRGAALGSGPRAVVRGGPRRLPSRSWTDPTGSAAARGGTILPTPNVRCASSPCASLRSASVWSPRAVMGTSTTSIRGTTVSTSAGRSGSTTRKRFAGARSCQGWTFLRMAGKCATAPTTTARTGPRCATGEASPESATIPTRIMPRIYDRTTQHLGATDVGIVEDLVPEYLPAVVR